MGGRETRELWQTFLTSAGRILQAERTVIFGATGYHEPLYSPPSTPDSCLARLAASSANPPAGDHLICAHQPHHAEYWHGSPLPGHDGGMIWACWYQPADTETLARLRELAVLAGALQTETEASTFARGLLRTLLHELRTPLTIIRGYVDLLRGGHALPETMRASAMTAMLEQTQRQEQIIREFSDAADLRLSAARSAPLDVCQTLRPALEAAGLTVTMRCESPTIPVAADDLKQTVLSLLRILPILGRRQGPGRADMVSDATTATLTITVPTEQPPIGEIAAILAHHPDDGPRARHGWTLSLLAVQHALERQGGRLSVEHRPPDLVYRLSWPRCPESWQAA